MSILKREILYPGKNDLGDLKPETKLIFHFETVIYNKKDSDPILVDDSRRFDGGKPVETLYGKQFKLPIWESCLSSMRKGEICQLTVRDDPETHYICLNYVITSRCFRKNYKVKPTDDHHHGHSTATLDDYPTHNCSMSLNSSPYKDLNRMTQNPPEIFVFTFELIDAIPSECYTKEIWQMKDQEKRSMLPKLREEGNRNFVECDYDGAISSYTRALGIIESLILKEKPGDSEYNKLDELRSPFLLNLAQVKLNQGEYYDCIRHTNEVLKRNPTNIKALFRRARAHAAVWDIGEAKKDFKKCVEYDKNMAKSVNKCIQEMETRELLKVREDRERFGKMFTR